MLCPNKILYLCRHLLTDFRGPQGESNYGHVNSRRNSILITEEGEKDLYAIVNLNYQLIVTNLGKFCLERITLSSFEPNSVVLGI